MVKRKPSNCKKQLQDGSDVFIDILIFENDAKENL